MSREKECKCCHEWWYASVIKEDLCPDCYDYFKQLKQQLEEKDKEIERLKVFEKAYYFNLSSVSKEYIKLMLQNAYQKPNQSQLAIQELEKVKEWLEPKYFDYEQINYLSKIINQQIKELKGEKQ